VRPARRELFARAAFFGEAGLNRQQMTRALGCRPPALVVDLGSGDVAVTEKLLDLDDVHAGIQQQSGGRGPEGVGSEDGLPSGRAVQ
jgi:hypothetical protein